MKTKRMRVVFLVMIVLVIMGGVFLYFQHQKMQKEQKIENIKSHYEEYVSLKKDAPLYTKENEKIIEFGRGKENTSFALEEIEITNEMQEYFQIKNENFYVYYEDVIPQDDITIEKKKDYYLESKDKIKTKEKTTFYKNKEFILELNQSMEFAYFLEDEEYYQIEYLGKIFEIKKDSAQKLHHEEELEQTEFIPVLKIEEIKEDCDTNTCIKTETLKNDLKILKENEMYTITLEDYKLWNQGFISLKKGAIFLNDNQDIKELLTEFNFLTINSEEIKLNINNTVSKKDTNLESINTYTINEETKEEHLQKIMNGENVVYPQKEVPKSSSQVTKTLPSKDAQATQIAVLNYHFFYDPNGEICPDSICLDVNKFREHLTYLKENEYKTLTIEEYRAWMYGEIELPARSVLITIDDGAKGTGRHNGNKLIPLLEEFDMHATLFLISGWWSKENYVSKNLDIESHTFDMHTEKICTTETRGAQMLCSTKEQVMEDLKKSIDTIGSNTAFCFPFYAYNNSAIESVKESGFKLAFIGGSTKSNRNNAKFKIPRYPIQSNITLNQFINMIA